MLQTLKKILLAVLYKTNKQKVRQEHTPPQKKKKMKKKIKNSELINSIEIRTVSGCGENVLKHWSIDVRNMLLTPDWIGGPIKAEPGSEYRKWPQNCPRTVLDETLSQHVPLSKETGNEPRPSATTMLTRMWLEYKRQCLPIGLIQVWIILSKTSVLGAAGSSYDDVMTWRRFSHYWPFVRGIHRWPMGSPHKGPVIKCFCVSLISLNKLLSEVSCTGALRHHAVQASHIIQHRTMKKVFPDHYQMDPFPATRLFD